MKGNTIIILAGTILCLGVFMPHSRGDTDVLTTGKLILSWARSVYEADLQTKRIQAIPSLNDEGFIYQQLSKIDEERFLYDKSYLEDTIHEYNRKTHTSKLIRTGRKPTYIPEHGKFFFYYHNPVTKQTRLYIADLKEPVASAREVGQGLYISTELHVIQVSHDEIVFPEDSNQHKYYKIWRYNLVTAELKALPIKNCLPHIWRSATRQLLCFDMPKQRYYLTNLDGKEMQYLPELKDDIAETYVPEYDILVLGKARLELFPQPRGEIHSLWAYRFKERKMVRLFKEARGGRGAVIWYEH